VALCVWSLDWRGCARGLGQCACVVVGLESVFVRIGSAYVRVWECMYAWEWPSDVFMCPCVCDNTSTLSHTIHTNLNHMCTHIVCCSVCV